MYMNAKSYAEFLGLPVDTVRRFCREGTLPCLKAGRVYLINTEQAAKVLEEMSAPRPHFTDFQQGIDELMKLTRERRGAR